MPSFKRKLKTVNWVNVPCMQNEKFIRHISAKYQIKFASNQISNSVPFRFKFSMRNIIVNNDVFIPSIILQSILLIARLHEQINWKRIRALQSRDNNARTESKMASRRNIV